MAMTDDVNVGTADRLVRIAVGAPILSLVFVGPQSLWGLVGALPLVTGLFGFCPFYSVFGLSTVGRRHQQG